MRRCSMRFAVRLRSATHEVAYGLQRCWLICADAAIIALTHTAPDVPLPIIVRDLSAKWFHLCHCWLSMSTACGVWCMCVICVICVIAGYPPWCLVHVCHLCHLCHRRLSTAATHGVWCMCAICVMAAWQPAADLV